MDDRTRRRLPLLLLLLIVLAAVTWWNLQPTEQAPQSSRARAARPAQRPGTSGTGVERVRLEALAAPRPTPTTGGRDPFRFRPAAPPVTAARVPNGDSPSVTGDPSDSGAPPSTGPPPIPLRFIGVVRLPPDGRLIAVLSDANGVYRGSEGDIIEGRYRIVRLRPEAVELAHVDGRGHQVIRLSGS